MMVIVAVSVFLTSCYNDIWEITKPSWLGESIYDQLKSGYKDDNNKTHTFTIFVRLIDDLGYTEVLKLTGSKTVFVADDEAFDTFFKSNEWGVSSYEQLTESQKRLIVNSSMINNAYLIELLPNIEGPGIGQALRRSTALSVLDTICFEKPENLPINNTNWDAYRTNGIHLIKDDSPIPMLHFLQKQMEFKGITDDDFSLIYNGLTRQKDDAYIFTNKIIVRDITCKNGYINILDGVLIPKPNMAEIIKTAPETKAFSRLLERFSAPYYNASVTKSYKLLHPDFTDSIFTKRYFAESSSIGRNTMNQKNVTQTGFLEYDPGWNTFAVGNGSTAMQKDMGVIFVPTDEVLNSFFETGGGKFLVEKYGSIDNIPNDVLDNFIRNLMKTSFLGSLPHAFSDIVDDGKRPMGISKSNIIKSYIANNGIVYVTNKIFAPASYVAVTAPILINENTKIINKEITAQGFDAYLLSMDSRYSLMVPIDIPTDQSQLDGKQGAMYYVDPVSYSRKQPEIFKIKYKPAVGTIPAMVTASAFKYDISSKTIGDSIRVVTPAEIDDRFNDILDYHVVVGDVESGKNFYQTKGGGFIKVETNGSKLNFLGGGNIELNKYTPKVTHTYDQTSGGNGKTYLVNSPILPPYNSVYKTLSDSITYPDFKEFFKLLANAPGGTIFAQGGMDQNVVSFNTFHYTVYVPTNNAILTAINKGLPTWDKINLITDDQLLKDSLTNVLLNFLRYHFQDNSVFIDGSSKALTEYETAAYTLTGTKAYYKLYSKLNSDGITLFPDPTDNSTAVQVSSSIRNIMARDYKFNNVDIEKATQIETSSWAVIHQIDNVLLYQKNILSRSKRSMNSYKASHKKN